MTQAQRIIIKSGGKAKDEALIDILLEDAENEFLAHTKRKEVPAAAKGLIEDMVIFKINHNENRGLASQSYSGVSEAYTTDYDTDIKAALNQWRKIKLL